MEGWCVLYKKGIWDMDICPKNWPECAKGQAGGRGSGPHFSVMGANFKLVASFCHIVIISPIFAPTTETMMKSQRAVRLVAQIHRFPVIRQVRRNSTQSGEKEVSPHVRCLLCKESATSIIADEWL